MKIVILIYASPIIENKSLLSRLVLEILFHECLVSLNCNNLISIDFFHSFDIFENFKILKEDLFDDSNESNEFDPLNRRFGCENRLLYDELSKKYKCGSEKWIKYVRALLAFYRYRCTSHYFINLGSRTEHDMYDKDGDVYLNEMQLICS